MLLVAIRSIAVVEHFPNRGTNGIWNRGGEVGAVLEAFTQEQRQALQVCSADMATHVREFLTETFPCHDLNRVAHCFMLRFAKPVLQKQIQSHEQNQNCFVKI